MTVKVVDRGWNAMIDRLDACRKLGSKVGYPTAESGETYEDGMTVLDVAVIHEFGAPKANIPQRAHVRAAYDEDLENLARMAKNEMGLIVDGKSTPEESITRLGEYHAGVIKNKIRTGPFVPLKPQTVRRKGSSAPLIDTGQMINSVTHVEGIFA